LKKPQLIVILLATLICVAVIIFAPRTQKGGPGAGKENIENQPISTQTILDGAKTTLTGSQKISLLSIENQLNTAKAPADRAAIYRQLSKFWADSAQRIEPYLYYTYSAALLENSEKSLTFAAQLLVDNLATQEAPPAIQNWIAANAKVLLEKALVINPNNDSAIINLGACYLFGNISDNPMQGILKVKEVVDKNPQNIYGNMMLGLGGKKSGQYPKAIERFLNILKLEPKNMEAMVNLAECYELSNQKSLAIEWYTKIKGLIDNPEAKDAIDKRIKELKK
jgi:tetratricopeptide (TPR) repeat protein